MYHTYQRTRLTVKRRVGCGRAGTCAGEGSGCSTGMLVSNIVSLVTVLLAILPSGTLQCSSQLP